MTEAVRPAALLPFPDVYTPIGATFSTNLSSWLLAVPGSPSNRRLTSPRRVRPSGRRFLAPPKRRLAIAFLISKHKELQFSYILPFLTEGGHNWLFHKKYFARLTNMKISYREIHEDEDIHVLYD